MFFLENKTRRIRPALWMIPLALIILFLVFFWNDVLQVAWFFISIALIILGFDLSLDTSPGVIKSLEIVFFNSLAGFGLIFLIWLFRAAAQTLLPVTSFAEVNRAAWHLLLYILRLHGPAIFVRDGEQLASAEELQRVGPGVVVIDFNSAAVLEEQIPPPGILRPLKNLIMRFLILADLSDPPAPRRVRTCGPGIVFMRRRERVRAALDLRNQRRVRQDIPAYTRDGIELSANVFCSFTIGREPDILDVVYIGDHRPENLRVVKIERVPGTPRVKLTGFEDDLDEMDRIEIHRYARVAEKLGDILPFGMPREPALQPSFDPNRVFAAAITEARDPADELMPWYELPAQVAVDVFRRIISQVNYDDFFGTPDRPTYQVPVKRRQLSSLMRNEGLLAYRLVMHRARVTLKDDLEYEEADLRVSREQQLKNPKLLRERGIVMLVSGFSELIPASDLIPIQRLESWSAPWQRELEIQQANGDLSALRAGATAQANAQENLYITLREILSNQQYSQEARALRVLQALEQASVDPETRPLLTSSTLDLLKSMHYWFYPGELRFRE